MQGEVPMMFEIVAVGATARTFEFLIPCSAIFFRSGPQSSRPPRSTSTATPRSAWRSSTVSGGRIPRYHFDHA
jgi:hypothetical protein